jgi:hypothetical protein
VILQVHIEYVLVRLFTERATDYECDTAVKRVLLALCTLYAIHGIVENSGDFLQVAPFNSFTLVSK